MAEGKSGIAFAGRASNRFKGGMQGADHNFNIQILEALGGEGARAAGQRGGHREYVRR